MKRLTLLSFTSIGVVAVFAARPRWKDVQQMASVIATMF